MLNFHVRRDYLVKDNRNKRLHDTTTNGVENINQALLFTYIIQEQGNIK